MLVAAASDLMQHVAMCFCCSLYVYTVTIGQNRPYSMGETDDHCCCKVKI